MGVPNAAVFSRNCKQCVVHAGPTRSISVLVENMGHVNFASGMNDDQKGARHCLHGAPPDHHHIIFLLVCFVGILGKVYFEQKEAVGWYHIPIALEQLFKSLEKDTRNSSELSFVPTFYVGMCPYVPSVVQHIVRTRMQYLVKTR